MDALSLNNLLVFLRGLSFNEREWLASRMLLPSEKSVAADRVDEFDAFPTIHDTDDQIRDNLRRSFKELKDYKDGKVEFQPADELLKELRAV